MMAKPRNAVGRSDVFCTVAAIRSAQLITITTRRKMARRRLRGNMLLGWHPPNKQ
jgi:hypothetical protein